MSGQLICLRGQLVLVYICTVSTHNYSGKEGTISVHELYPTMLDDVTEPVHMLLYVRIYAAYVLSP